MPNQNEPLPSTNPLLNRFFLSPQEKADKENGKKIIKQFYTQQTTNDGLSYFKQRNARQIELSLWSKGSQNMKEFLDYMNVSDGNKAYVNIDMTQQRVAAQFVNTLVETMSKTSIYPCVKAIDDGSMNEKEEREFEALFRMKEVQTINDVQQQTGMQIEPDNVFIPDDELSARVYFKLEDRLPKEIRFEEFLKKIQNDIKFDRVLNKNGIRDIVVLNMEATVIEKKDDGSGYTVRKWLPTNTVYNFFMNDTGEQEVDMIGNFYNLKVKDFRSKYGQSPQNPNGLTEQQIFKLAKQSNTKNLGKFNWFWDNRWTSTTFLHNKPYDDFSILVIEAYINCGEDVYYTSKKDSFGKENIQEKKGIPYAPQVKKDGTLVIQEKPEDVEVIKSRRMSWMKGVYAPFGDEILFWGAPDVIISPYTDTSHTLCPVSINIPNNDGEYVPSLFERGMEPLREYTITKLKRKQLIAKLKPSGIRIDVESARNLDLGNGDSIAWEEVVRIYDQTGNELWSSKGVNPLERESPPLGNTVQTNDIQQIIGLTNLLGGIVNELRMLYGTSVFLEGGDVGERTAATLAENQVEQASNVFGYVLNGHYQVWEETFYKLCLLHWNEVVQQEPETKNDLLNTRFDVAIKMRPTDYEKQLLEADIQRYSQMPDSEGNPSITPKDAFMLREIDDPLLARWYLANTWETNRKNAIKDSQRLQQQNAAEQAQVAQQNAAQAAQMQQAKLDQEKEMLDYKTTKEKELALLTGFFQVASQDKTGTLVKMFFPAIQQLVPNISIPLAVENDDLEKGAQAKQMEEQMEAAQQQQPQQGQQGQSQMQQPQQQMPPQAMQQNQPQPQMQ